MDECSTHCDSRELTEASRLVDESDCRVSTLSNGMTLAWRRHDASPLVSVRVYVRSGSVFEADRLGSGISHLMEHVVTSGASTARSEEALLHLGDSIGGLVNAYTSCDHICYHLVAAKEDLGTSVNLLADWVVRPVISSEVYQREIGVVLRELERDRDDPETQLDELFHEVVYRNHPMQYPVIGHRDSLLRLTHDDLVSYVEDAHAPENMVVVVAGDVHAEEVMSVVSREFADLKRRPSNRPPLPEPLSPVGPRRAVKQMDVESVSMEIAWPTVREGDLDDVRLDLLSSVLAEGASSRLIRRLRWEQSVVFDISGTHESTWHTPGTFLVSAQLDPDKLSEVEQSVLDVIGGLEGDPVTEAELDRAKRQTVMAFELQRQTAEGYATQIGEDLLATGDVYYSDTYLASVEETSTADLMRVARQYLRPEVRTVVAVVPKEKGRRSQSRAARDAGMLVERRTLDNGLTCLTRPMPDSPFVAMYLGFAGGLCEETSATSGLFNLMAECMSRGTPARKAEEIAEFFAACGSGLVVGSGLSAFGLECIGLADDFESLFEMLAEVATSPAFVPEEIDKLRPAICDAIARMDEDWHSELIRFSRARFFEHSPYRFPRLGTIEGIRRFTREDLVKVHSRFVTGRGGVLSIAGNVTCSRVEALAERCLGGLDRGNEPFANHVPVEPDPTAERLFIKEAGNGREVAGLFVGYPGCALKDMDIRASLSVLWTMLAGYTLSSGRLYAALRGGRRDMVYDVSGAHLAGTLPGYIGVIAACEPARVNEVNAIMRREIASLCAGGFSDEEIARARAMIFVGELEQMQTPGDHARGAGFDTIVGLSIDDRRRFLDEIRRVSRDDLLDVARQFITLATTVVVTPEPSKVDFGLKAILVSR